jgi:hypothetical protein
VRRAIEWRGAEAKSEALVVNDTEVAAGSEAPTLGMRRVGGWSHGGVAAMCRGVVWCDRVDFFGRTLPCDRSSNRGAAPCRREKTVCAGRPRAVPGGTVVATPE